MWWKILSVALVIYALTAGMLVPLKPGILQVSPRVAHAGDSVTLRISGYNSFYTKSTEQDIRVWLKYDSAHALAGQVLRILSDTTLEARFVLPKSLPNGERSYGDITAILDNAQDGHSLLPKALTIVNDSSARGSDGWKDTRIEGIHVRKDFSFPYQNINYESLRNTFYHVPMWFALMFLFLASVVYSIAFLVKPSPENDRKASAYAETGLLFGFLGLFTGMVWANYTWGKPWSNDIKQLMTAVMLLIYTAYFILRRSFDEPEKGARLAAVYNIFAFASLIPLLYIIPRMFASLHPGATGNPAFGSQDLDNTMRLVFYPAIIGWSLLGFWIAQLRFRYQRLLDKSLGL